MCAISRPHFSGPIHTHTNPWGRLMWPYAITRLTAHFVCGLISNLVIWKFRKSMVIHDTECPSWAATKLVDQNRGGSVVKQHKNSLISQVQPGLITVCGLSLPCLLIAIPNDPTGKSLLSKHALINTYTARPICWSGWISDSYCSLKPLCSGHGGSSAGSYPADPTSPIPSHCAVIILFQSVTVHQLSRLAL